jgi:hypothetical protein
MADVVTPPRPRLKRYLAKAFSWKWNLGLFFAALGFAALSPAPDALLPIVMGAEGLFLFGMAANPKFRQAVDAQEAKKTRQAGAVSTTRTYLELLDQLDTGDRERFRRLVMRCQDLQAIAPSASAVGATEADKMRQSALDRLLYFYLRLLITRDGLTSFLSTSDVNSLRAQRGRVEAQLQKAQEAKEERLTSSLADTLTDLDARIVNVEKSQKDAEYIDVELQRIEVKVHALAESAVTRQDPTALSAQVTAFTDTLKLSQDVEARMVSLQGLELASADAPPILSATRAVVRE